MIQTPEFWLVLLGASVLVWFLPLRWRDGFVALVSAGFLGFKAPQSVALLALWGALFLWLAVPQGESSETSAARRRVLARYHVALILGVLAMLAWFKYLPPIAAALSTNEIEEHVVVPLGMSYFVFKLVHYAVEVARGKVRERRPASFAAWLFLFPIFTAGPIERYDHFVENRDERWTLDAWVFGLTRIVHGLIKKLLLAETLVLGLIGERDVGELLAHLDAVSTGEVTGFLLLYLLYVYFDFSAYSDICIGASRLLGWRIGENFNNPLLARNINEYWKRWHMSLSGWCQTYVYLPTIGLTRNPYLAIVSTFVVMGLWHVGSLTRFSWGLYQALGVIVFTRWAQIKRRRKWKALDRAPWNLLGAPITWLFLAGSMTFLATEAQSHGFWQSLRLLAKLAFVDLPPAPPWSA